MKRILLLFITVLITIIAYSKPVSEETAKQVAQNFIYEHTGIIQGNIIFTDVLNRKSDDIGLYYILNYKNGYVIVSADDIITPVLAYSTENTYSEKDIPLPMKTLLNLYAKQIELAVKNKSESFPDVPGLWRTYSCPSEKFSPAKSTKDVAPLLGTIEWAQGTGWNTYCPVDAEGSDGHALVGCVATATGQIMRYWNYPSSGTGSHSYTPSTHPEYGLQSADFENTTIDWASMSNTTGTNPAALLLYHIGVALEMDYGPDGSSANTTDVHYILDKYYKYKNTATHIRKINYTDNEWKDILRNEVDHGRPVLYRGADEFGDGGHAFVLDGYSGDWFHINWGWGGAYNDIFLLDDLTPGSYDFSYGSSCCINIEPDYSEPYSLSADLTDNDVSLSWTMPTSWNRYAYMYFGSNINWGGPDRYTLFDNADFGFTYPAVITGISHAFYNHSTNLWVDSTFTFRIYNSGGTMIFESEQLEAKHKEEVFYKLSSPIEINGDVYVGVHSIDGTGNPSSFSNKVAYGETHSYKYNGSTWTQYNSTSNLIDAYEMICGIEISGSGLLKSSKSGVIDGYQIFRDDTYVGEVSGSVFTYNDNDVAAGSHDYCIKTVYDEGLSECSESQNVNITTNNIKSITSEYEIYPNPATDHVNLILNEYPATIKIFDISGKEVYSEIVSRKAVIYTNDLNDGIYIMHIRSEHYTDNIKLQISK